MLKAAITLSWPIRWKRIANGEKIIEQAGPDEIEVDVREGEIKGESWLREISKLLDGAEREKRKSRRENADPRKKVQIPTMSKGGGQKTTAKRTGAVE